MLEFYIKGKPLKTSEAKTHVVQIDCMRVLPIKKFQIISNGTPLTTPKMILKTLKMLDRIRHLAGNNSSGI